MGQTFENIIFLSIFRGFVVDEGQAVIPINMSVVGDITVIAYHARSTFGGKVQGKVRIICHFIQQTTQGQNLGVKFKAR